MKVKLYEAKWLHIIGGELANRFRTALLNDDVEGAVKTSIELLESCRKFFDPEGPDVEIGELEDLIEDFQNVEHEYNAVDNLLDVLYDFCDEYHIWIPLIDEDETREEPKEDDAEEIDEPDELKGDVDFVEVHDEEPDDRKLQERGLRYTASCFDVNGKQVNSLAALSEDELRKKAQRALGSDGVVKVDLYAFGKKFASLPEE